MSEELYESTWHIVHDDGRAWEDDELEDLISAELRGVSVTASGVIFAIDKSLQAHMLVEDVEVVVDTWHLEHEDGREWTREELDRIVGQYLELDEDPSYKLSLDGRE